MDEDEKMNSGPSEDDTYIWVKDVDPDENPYQRKAIMFVVDHVIPRYDHDKTMGVFLAFNALSIFIESDEMYQEFVNAFNHMELEQNNILLTIAPAQGMTQ